MHYLFSCVTILIHLSNVTTFIYFYEVIGQKPQPHRIHVQNMRVILKQIFTGSLLIFLSISVHLLFITS